MNYKQALKLFYSKLDKLMSSYGYKKDKDRWYLRNLRTGGWYCYFLSESDTGQGYSFEPYMAVRLDMVENICHKFSNIAVFAQDTTTTLQTPLSEYLAYNGPQGGVIRTQSVYMREIVTPNAENIDEIVQKIFDYFVQYGLQYYNKVDNYQSVHHLLNSEPMELSLYLVMNPDRIMRGLIIAKLVNANNLEELVEIYREQMKICREALQLQFEQLVEYLPNIEPLEDLRIY